MQGMSLEDGECPQIDNPQPLRTTDLAGLMTPQTHGPGLPCPHGRLGLVECPGRLRCRAHPHPRVDVDARGGVWVN